MRRAVVAGQAGRSKNSSSAASALSNTILSSPPILF
jgi:hypothetical protein